MSLSILGSPRLLSTRVQRRIRTLQGRTRHRLGLPVPRPSQRAVTPRRRLRSIDFYATVEVAA